MLESGDILVVRRFRERRGDILGIKVQLIEGDRISNPDGLPDTTRLAGGVEIDGNGAPLRYHVLNNHPGDLYYLWAGGDSWTSIPAFGRSSQERLAILLYRRTRPNQVRGVPYLAPVIEPLKQLDRYSEAELTAAVVAGMFTVFVKAESAGDEGGIAPLSDTQSQLTDTTSGDIRLGSGTIIDLMPGEDVVTADPKRPNIAYDAFVQSVLRQIGVGLELPYEILIKHFTRSYSAARTSILEAWKFFRVRRDWLAKRFCQPVYSWVISEAVMRELIAAPGFQDATIRDAWLGAKWIGPAPGQIDPEREINAADKRVVMGISTLEEETAALTGGDWDQKHRQRAKERQMRYEAGLESSEVGAGEKLAPPPAAEREAEEEEAVA